MPQQKAEHLTYTDSDGNSFEVTIVRRFDWNEKNYILAKERPAHHEHGPNCACHDHDAHHSDDGEEELYVFELRCENHVESLAAVSDEKLMAMSSILESL